MPKLQYPKRRESSIEWLGEIPEHWEVRRLKYIATASFSSVDKHTLEGELPVRLCNYVDVYYHDRITSDIDFMNATATQEEIRRFTLRRGDVLITKDSEEWTDIAVPAYVDEHLDNVLCGYHLAHISPDPNRSDGRYLFRAFAARGINDQFRVEATGVTRYGLGKYGLENALFPLPPIDEQRAIAVFLDKETMRIDGLIEKKERQIELLREKRSALISHAVTKGLNPSAKMKPSGVEWLGEIPDGWPVARLRFYLRMNPTKGVIRGLSEDTQVSFVPMEAVKEYGGLWLEQTRALEDVLNGYTYFQNGDVLVAKITPCFENGKGSIADGLENSIGFGTTELHVLRPEPSLNCKYLFYLTISHAFRNIGASYMYGAGGQKRVPDDFIRDFRHPIPSLAEQNAIAEFLDRETARIDGLIEKVQESIEKLQEYRSAVISAAVTGKIDVRSSLKLVEHHAQRQAPPEFKRAVLGAEIVHKLHKEPTFGRVKFEKIIYLYENHLGIDLDGNFQRQAAGPFDNQMLRSIESQMEKAKWYKAKKEGERTYYIPLAEAGKHAKYFDRYWADIRDQIYAIIELLRSLNTERVEIVATLFAAWNDLLLNGARFSDNDIIKEVRENWHESKNRFDEDRLQRALNWMRDKGLTPRGKGRLTRVRGVK